MKINELSDEAKERALDKLRERVEFHGEVVIEDWSTILSCLGFFEIDIYWSGFCSQGDGACFDAGWYLKNVDYAQLKDYLGEEKAEEYGGWFRDKHVLAKIAQEDVLNYYARVRHTGRYCNCASVRFEIDPIVDDGDDCPVFDEATFEEEFKDQCKSLMRQIYRDVEAEYEHQMSYEYLMEMAEINEFEFTEEGEWV